MTDVLLNLSWCQEFAMDHGAGDAAGRLFTVRLMG